ncbi:hypothetical protein DH2020_048540 [Rehmannia glutinosa]|uniref:Uncharacterized protein n=1 Tax=Rehmannia glutinosa TaxID=99300 RepID=A0ABR0U597_REHGL
MSTLKSDFDGNSSESIYRSYSFVHDHKPCKGNSSSLDSVPETKWWLNGHGLGRENQLIDEYYTTYAKSDAAFCSDALLKHSHSQCKNNGDSWLQEFESTFDVDLLSERPKKLCSDLDSNWIGLKMIEPWWDAVDKDDLASLVSRMSSHHIKNCDRPGLRSMHVEKVSDNCEICFDKFEEQMTDHTQGNLDSESMDKSVGKRGLMDCMLPESDGTFSSGDTHNTSKVDSSNTHETSNDLSRAQLLEALCHSQTRAREAEKFAQEACDEKDHIINLFFQQASCLLLIGSGSVYCS